MDNPMVSFVDDERPIDNGSVAGVSVDRVSLCSSESRDNRHKAHGNSKAMKKLIIACSLCFAFVCCELVGGYLAHSLAIMTDAAHLVTDLVGFLISLIAIFLVRKSPTQRLTFGWYRAEILGALFSIQLIWLITGVLVYLAVERVRTMDFHIEALPMIITASCGVVMNMIMAFVLHQKVPTSGHGHSHAIGHGHSHDSNINVRSAFIHCIGDLMQSLGVMAASLIIYFKPEYKIADPICTFLSSLFVMGTTLFIFRDTVFILMEGAPKSIKTLEIRSKLLSIPGISDVHNIRVWSLTTDKVACNLHISIDSTQITINGAIDNSQEILKSYASFHEIVIQVEENLADQFLSSEQAVIRGCE